MTIEELKKTDWIIMSAIVGSQSFGLATETSDTDIRGVFVLPLEYRIAYDSFDQVADEKNNEVYWELAKFLQLLNDSNPSALELLNSPERCILSGCEWFARIGQYDWLSLKCRDTFVNYAKSQLHRAYGLNKKVFDPQPEEPPRVLDFCHVVVDNGAMPVKEWLRKRVCNDQSWYALAAIDHITDAYAVFYQLHGDDDQDVNYSRWAYGMVNDEETSNDVHLSSIPKGHSPVATLFFNRNAYSRACKKHSEYWDWVKARNEARYAATVEQGKGYDAKNVMHCIRLLMTAYDIADRNEVVVDRTNDREFLFRIRNGELSYDEAVELGNDMVERAISRFEQNTVIKQAPFSKRELSEILVKLLNIKE